MRIIPTKPLAFKANIIDAHVHRGTENCLWNGIKFPTEKLDEFIKEPLTINVAGETQTDNVTRVLVSSIDGLAWDEEQKQKYGGIKSKLKPEELIFAKNELDANLDMINKYKKDDFYAVMAVCQPTKTNGSANNIEQLIKSHPNTIFGLKFHPQDLMLNADSPLYDKYLELAKKEKLPCLFHSQVDYDFTAKVLKENKNWSDPKYIYDLAKRHPDVPVIMGHMGSNAEEKGHSIAIDKLIESVTKKDAKLYVDISWVNFHNDLPVERPNSIIEVIDKAKKNNALDRILFGTDAPLGCYGEPHKLEITKMTPKEAYELTVSRIKTAIKNNYGAEADSIINKIFYENANELFFEKNWAKGPEKKLPKHITPIAIGTVCGIGVISMLYKNLSHKKTGKIPKN